MNKKYIGHGIFAFIILFSIVQVILLKNGINIWEEVNLHWEMILIVKMIILALFGTGIYFAHSGSYSKVQSLSERGN
ncbi:hypothetical protein LCGC14_2664150 [marine sediment metagenome]|uniref:Uncharacterized protein n=1 Tax=marine sediment metagenome TaxID=412755 RepID=A0A0F9ADF2_9ZZZZ